MQKISENAAVAENLDFFSEFLWNFGKWAGAAILFLSSFAIAKMIKNLIIRKIENRVVELPEELMLLLDRSIYFGVVVLLSIISFKIVDIDLSWAIGALSFGLGFAFKDLLANFIGGVVILTQQKFKIGHLVKIGDTIGKIEKIDVRTTEIRALDGTSLIIPNSEMITSVMQNFTKNSFRRISFELQISYDSEIQKATEIILEIFKKNPQIIPQPAPAVFVKNFADSGISLECRFWVETISKKSWKLTQSEILTEIKNEFDAQKIKIPFPTREIISAEKNFDEKNLQKNPEILPEKNDEKNFPEMKKMIDEINFSE